MVDLHARQELLKEASQRRQTLFVCGDVLWRALTAAKSCETSQAGIESRVRSKYDCCDANPVVQALENS
jgi:hypothetical protein